MVSVVLYLGFLLCKLSEASCFANHFALLFECFLHCLSVLKLIKTDNDPGGPMNTGIISHTGPSAPKYCTVESRLRTFHDWPSELRQRPADMADAGFYHILPRGGASRYINQFNIVFLFFQAKYV